MGTHTYPLDDWRITETAFDVESNLLDETLFALGNGYIGLRGTQDEGFVGTPMPTFEGTYLNGFYETSAIHYPETAYGLARQNQFMLNVPNGKRIELWLDEERFDLLQGRTLRYERTLDLREGVLRRTVNWQSPEGRHVEVVSERLVCLKRKHVFAIRYAVRLLNFEGRVKLVSALDARTRNLEAGDDPRVGSHVKVPPLQWLESRQTDSGVRLVHRTRTSSLTLVSALEHQCEGGRDAVLSRESLAAGQCLTQIFSLQAGEGETVTLVKFGAYHSSRDFPEAELMQRSDEALAEARAAGFDALCREQQEALAAFWREADVQIGGDAALQQGMRFNLYHLLQSVGRDGKTNIAAKGVTGEGYEGHYFWDTEIYVFPFFLATQPQIARQLLAYRWAGLPAARERAREMAHAKGALYPWRTIAGAECSAYFPAGTAQYHINADIAHSIKLYVETTGDEKYLREQGAEVLMETARIWMGLGHFDERRGGAFCIHEVTGPDEYTAMVSNNFYTNAMAQQHLAYAASVAERLQRKHPKDFARIAAAMELSPDEPGQWRRAAEAMYLPLDEQLGVHPQDDSFLHKPAWDFANTPPEKYPLLLHYHPLVIYRHRVCKQADVVLALLLRGERFTLEQKRRDFDYYEPLTTHDSSLSACIFSIVASEVGYADKAYDYFMHTARMDLDNEHGNTQYGVHTAAMAGTWMGVVYGFAGMRIHEGQLRFAPRLPARWTHYGFRLRVRGRQLQVQVRPGEAEYRLLEGESLELQHEGRTLRLSARQPVQTLPLSR
ncbi:MAG: glycosyl hydrolase family 65 protein [Pseudomonadota bacterium]